MKNYVSKFESTDPAIVTVCFYIEEDRIMEIGERMNELNEDAYMNGYNWGAFLESYLQVKHAEVLENMEVDPEAGMYAAYYPASNYNLEKADKLISIIENLVEDENTIYEFLTANADIIGWN